MLSLYTSHHTNLCRQEFCMVVVEDPTKPQTVKIRGDHLHEIGKLDQTDADCDYVSFELDWAYQ